MFGIYFKCLISDNINSTYYIMSITKVVSQMELLMLLTGQSSNLFAQQKERGADLIITRITAGLTVAFFVIAIIIRMS